MTVGGRTVRPRAVTQRARVSVVVPCYNYGRYLSDAVCSALEQPDVDVDVVIVDDASTDDSADVAASLAEADPRVRVVRHARNAGHVETSNEALSLATGEFVVKLDADDMLTPGSLARSAALLLSFPEVVLCYGHPVEFHDDVPAVGDGPARDWTVWRGDRWLDRVLRDGRNVIMQPEVMLRRGAVADTGGYLPRLRWAEDYHWWMRLALVGDIGRVNGVAQGLYRVHGASFQRSSEDVELSDLRARVEATTVFLAEHGVAPRLERRATLALLRDARRLAARAADRPDVAAAAAFDDVATSLRSRVSGLAVPGLSASRSGVGRAYRDLEGRLGWRRWKRWGVR